MSTTQERVTINITDGTKKLSQKDFKPFKTEQIKRINIPRSVEEIKCTAVLMEYKNKVYPDYSITDEFTLE